MTARAPEAIGRTFWRASGHHLVEATAEGRLAVTDDLLRAYLLRPELVPVEESCRHERALHEALLAAPRAAVTAGQLERLADPDARDNYRTVLRFRDHLLAMPSLEAAYLELVRGDLVGTPPVFLDQLVHLILRHVLTGCDDPLRLRAAELLFREQKATIQDGRVLLADEETVEMLSRGAGYGGLGRLLVDLEAPLKAVDLDILDPDNGDLYWARSDRFDTVLDLGFTRPGLDGLCRVLEAWLRHLLGLEVRIQPMRKIEDQRWSWHVGLDAEASLILNDLYAGREVGEDRLRRLLALFRLDFVEPTTMAEPVRGRPVYLGLAMNPAARVRLKPQNLLVSLPLAGTA